MMRYDEKRKERAVRGRNEISRARRFARDKTHSFNLASEVPMGTCEAFIMRLHVESRLEVDCD